MKSWAGIADMTEIFRWSKFFLQHLWIFFSLQTIWDAMHVEDSFFDGVYTMKLTEMPASLWKKQQQQQQQQQAMLNVGIY